MLSTYIWLLLCPSPQANSPHLTPAFVLDEALLQFSAQLAAEEHAGITPFVWETTAVHTLVHTRLRAMVESLRLWEFYVVNKATVMTAFRAEVEAAVKGGAVVVSVPTENDTSTPEAALASLVV